MSAGTSSDTLSELKAFNKRELSGYPNRKESGYQCSIIKLPSLVSVNVT